MTGSVSMPLFLCVTFDERILSLLIQRLVRQFFQLLYAFPCAQKCQCSKYEDLHLHPSSSQLHRRLLYDDSRGVAEPLNETSDIFPDGLVVRGRLLLSLERPASAADIHRLLAQEMVLQPLLTFTDGDLHPNTKLEVSHIHSNINYLNFILTFIVTF